LETFWRIYRRATDSPAGRFFALGTRIETNAALDHLRTTRCGSNSRKIWPAARAADPASPRETRTDPTGFLPVARKITACGHTGADRRGPYDKIAEAVGISRGSGQGARVSRRAHFAQRNSIRWVQRFGANEQRRKNKKSRGLSSSIAPLKTRIRRDLWPQMLQKLSQPPARVPWFDWRLLRF